MRNIANIIVLILLMPVVSTAYELPDNVSGSIDAFLRSKWDGADLDWSVSGGKKAVQKLGNLKIEIEGPEKPHGKTILFVVNKDKKLAISVDIHVKTLVPIMNKRKERHEEVKIYDVVWEKRDVTKIYNEWVNNKEVIQNDRYRMRRRMNKGDVLICSAMEKVPDILKNDIITIDSIKGNVRVTVSGVALQDGFVGDRIRVRNTDHNKILSGKIVADNRVEVR